MNVETMYKSKSWKLTLSKTLIKFNEEKIMTSFVLLKVLIWLNEKKRWKSEMKQKDEKKKWKRKKKILK